MRLLQPSQCYTGWRMSHRGVCMRVCVSVHYVHLHRMYSSRTKFTLWTHTSPSWWEKIWRLSHNRPSFLIPNGCSCHFFFLSFNPRWRFTYIYTSGFIWLYLLPFRRRVSRWLGQPDARARIMRFVSAEWCAVYLLSWQHLHLMLWAFVHKVT